MKNSNIDLFNPTINLKNLRSKLSTMDTQIAIEEHKKIADRICPKKTRDKDIIEEYQCLTNELLLQNKAL